MKTINQFEFSNDWFSGNVFGRGQEIDIPAIWKILFTNFSISRVLEIGSYEGRSTIFLAENLKNSGPIELTCIDTWQGSKEHDSEKHVMSEVESRFDNNIKMLLDRQQNVSIRKIKKTSVEGCAQLIAEHELEKFDLIYVDGSHSARDVLTDAVQAFHLLRTGGLLIFDDYLWDYGFNRSRNPLEMPKPGIDAFVNIFQDELKIIHGFPNYQLYCIKVGFHDRINCALPPQCQSEK